MVNCLPAPKLPTPRGMSCSEQISSSKSLYSSGLVRPWGPRGVPGDASNQPLRRHARKNKKNTSHCHWMSTSILLGSFLWKHSTRRFPDLKPNVSSLTLGFYIHSHLTVKQAILGGGRGERQKNNNNRTPLGQGLKQPSDLKASKLCGDAAGSR